MTTSEDKAAKHDGEDNQDDDEDDDDDDDNDDDDKSLVGCTHICQCRHCTVNDIHQRTYKSTLTQQLPSVDISWQDLFTRLSTPINPLF